MAMRQQSGVRGWAYVDDRSISAHSAVSQQDAEDKVAHALATTSEIDDQLLLKENVEKRQLWREGQDAEHLGIRAVLGRPLADAQLPPPRNG